ncbi:osmoprotectant transport system permease protein [Halobacillus karajensis]|uniref:Glycine betaine/carnitine/choline transport system permease protein OpuCB n=1 Tax=Halobacillus karajensis TaxID=195088 RepID=A0A024P2D7_9BACI|nr:ABC transporter permease/substrate-binding protein [Halobacillus karajensis]CDQ19616.1 Glycine betaine/carnitine/choline transport system permease protein OpuCB [Halobacillus karajensis]CDQ22076.1 Glycine betaine/carnitine/choline transport system permease protein OpuCB [Halobacillus karajensis]CDQ27917.1 Glycine betaine/carnitine/choline transport system permease protein OpuCB [Halobacillus karajensis]SEH79474.1 osmoprotectant transport system permease protein [Halobacillus karajensis]
MSQFIDVFNQRQGILLEKVWEHLQISIIALVIATLISVPLGLWLTRKQKVAEPIIGVTAVLQTIPSLAVLAFLIPFFGIGQSPAIIALSAYGLLPILRNTYTGIKEVDPALKEAATGMGMKSFRRLTKIELPIAMPVIMAGIRTSMVLIVGTTTIAALIGAGGLGDLILLGLDRGGDANLILLGAIPAALLAIILDLVLRLFERTSAKSGFRSLVSLLVIAALIAVGPLAFGGKVKNDLTIGAKLGSEPAILIHMYKLLIEEETDLSVGLEPNLGKTDLVFSALQEGSIDIYPEFTGTAIVSLLGEEANSNEPNEVYQQAKEGMAEKYDLAFLEPMEYNNTYAVATTQELAEQYDLETIGDLKPVENQITAGFTLEFNDREDGYQGMKEMYNLDLREVRTMDPGLRQGAIESGEVDIIDAYATDGYMIDLNLKVLEDPKNLFPPYQGAPLLRQEILDRYPEIEEVLNQLGGKITGDQMREMNYQVDFEDHSPEEVAREYLIEEGLIKE